jgi:hypothetical protein
MLETHAIIDSDARHFARPKGVLLLMGALVFAGMTAEGVLYDWSVLYLEQDVAMPHARAALGYATFTGSMALARFGGDALRARFPERAVLRCSAVVAAVAMALVLLSANGWIAFLGLAAVGAGLAPVAPILFNAATRVPGVSRPRPSPRSRPSGTAAFSWSADHREHRHAQLVDDGALARCRQRRPRSVGARFVPDERPARGAKIMTVAEILESHAAACEPEQVWIRGTRETSVCGRCSSRHDAVDGVMGALRSRRRKQRAGQRLMPICLTPS